MQHSLRTYGGLFLFTVLSFLTLTVVSAQEPGETVRERAEVRAEERGERRAMLETRLQERIVNLASNVTTRLTGVIDRFGNIIARLDTRVLKLKAQGVDTARGEAKLSEAKRLLIDTSIALENIESVRTAMGGETPRESFQNIRREILAVREGLRGVQALLIETVALLKEAVLNAELGRGVSGAVTEGRGAIETPDEAVTNE